MQKLKDSELRYRRLFEAAQDGILILNAETGMIEDVNPYLIKMLGYSREEFVEKKLWEVGAFKDIQASKDAFEALQDKEYIRYEDLPLKAKDGRLIQVEFVSNVYVAGGEKIIQCNIRDITEHTRIILALQENEKKYHDLISQSPDGYFVIELSGNILTANKAMCKELEFSEEEFLALNIWDIIPGQYLDEYREKLTRVLQGESLQEVTEYEIRGKNGKNHYVEVLSAPRYKGKDILGFQGVARDVTARKRAEEALQESEARNRRLVENLPTVVYTNAVGDASSTLYVSPQIQTLLGYTPQEWVADPKLWSKTLHPEDREHVLRLAAQTDQSKEPFEMEYRMIARDGSQVWVHDQIVLVKDLQGQPQFWQGIMLDITARKRAQDALYESEERFRKAFQYSAIGMALVSLEGRWLKVNSAFCSIVGYSEDELLTKSFQDISHPDDLTRDLNNRKQLLAGEIKAYKMEKRYFHKEEKIVWVLLAVALARDNAGEPLYFITQMEDITENKLAEEALRKSESLLHATGKMARVGGWEFDVATVRVVWTEEVYEIHEAGPDYEPTISKWINSYAPEAVPVIAQAMQRAIEQGEPFDLELPIITVQGNRRWVHTMGQAQQSNRQTTKVSGTVQDITERQQGEEALRESESSLQGILRSTADGILAVSKENKTLFANERFIEMWRIPQAVLASQDDSLLLQHVLDQLNDPQAFLKKVEELYKSKEESFDTLYFKDGRVFERISHPLIRERISHPLIQKTELRGRVWSFRDVTERQHSEAALRESEERFRRAIQDAPYPIQIHAEGGEVLTINQSWTDLTGYVLSDIPTIQAWTEKAYPDRASALQEEINGLYSATGRMDEGEEDIHTSSGEIRTWKFSSAPLGKLPDGRRLVTSMAVDITERKRAEQGLQKEKDRAQQYLDIAGVIFLVLAADQKVTLINRKGCEILGYTEEEIVGQNWFDHFLPQAEKAEFRPEFDQILAGEMELIEYFESPILTKSGHERLIAWHNSALTDEAGRIIGVVSSGEDVTGRKQAEARIQRQLEHLTALSSIDRVIAGNIDLKLSLSEILTHVTAELKVDAADVLILNSNSQMLEYAAERGFRNNAIRKAQVRLGKGYAGCAALDRQLVQIQDLGAEPDNISPNRHLAGEDFACYFGVPLIAKGQVLGVLEVSHRATLEPDAEWLDFLYTLSGQAAIAIENATLFESLQRSNSELTQAYDATIEGWSHALDLRDKETEGHSLRVTEMTVRLARLFGLNGTELAQVRWGALLHDIGKMGVPDGILLKPGSLTDEEWVAMKKHPTFAYEMLSPIRYLRLALDIPYCHHEKWDGTGYPRGLKGEVIPLSARIFAVVDVWDALCSDRPYRPRWPEEKVREHINALSGTQFDPQVVEVFMQSLS